MSKSAKLKAACLGASLVTAWTTTKAEASGDFRVTAEGSGLSGLSSLIVVAGTLSISIPNNPDGTTSLQEFGSTVGWAGTICLAAPDNFANQPWELAGVGNGAASNEVVVAFSDPSKGMGQSFASLFPGTDETTLAAHIRKQSATASQFLLSIAPLTEQTPGASSSMIEFSDGVNIGSITVSVTQVPEPSSLGLIAMGVAGLFRRVWRRR
jgi:hypothetical protein